MLGEAHGRIAKFELESLNLRLAARNARTSLRSEILGKFEFAIEAFEFAGPEISEESRGKNLEENLEENLKERRELREENFKNLEKRVSRRESQEENPKKRISKENLKNQKPGGFSW